MKKKQKKIDDSYGKWGFECKYSILASIFSLF